MRKRDAKKTDRKVGHGKLIFLLGTKGILFCTIGMTQNNERAINQKGAQLSVYIESFKTEHCSVCDYRPPVRLPGFNPEFCVKTICGCKQKQKYYVAAAALSVAVLLTV